MLTEGCLGRPIEGSWDNTRHQRWPECIRLASPAAGLARFYVPPALAGDISSGPLSNRGASTSFASPASGRGCFCFARRRFASSSLSLIAKNRRSRRGLGTTCISARPPALGMTSTTFEDSGEWPYNLGGRALAERLDRPGILPPSVAHLAHRDGTFSGSGDRLCIPFSGSSPSGFACPIRSADVLRTADLLINVSWHAQATDRLSFGPPTPCVHRFGTLFFTQSALASPGVS